VTKCSGEMAKERFSRLFNLAMEKKNYGKDTPLGIGFERGVWRRIYILERLSWFRSVRFLV